jgi:hypothetical protein
MSEGPTAAGAAQRVGSGTTRLARAWRALPHESRLAAFASGALFITLFLPWYQVTLIARARGSTLESVSVSITGWGGFSFVEAAILLVAAGVITLLFQRAEGRAFHLPGGDGGVITAAGLWTCVLIVWRIFDKQGAATSGPSTTTSGIEWGIFVALAAAAFLAYSGSRIRAAHRPEPPLPGEHKPPVGSSAAATTVVRPPRRRVTASDLFERVVPEDPPTMPFGRAKRADIDSALRKAEAPPAPAPVAAPPEEEQLTIPFADHEDDTLPLAADHRSRSHPDEDATVRLGEDDTLPLDR